MHEATIGSLEAELRRAAAEPAENHCGSVAPATPSERHCRAGRIRASVRNAHTQQAILDCLVRIERAARARSYDSHGVDYRLVADRSTRDGVMEIGGLEPDHLDLYGTLICGSVTAPGGVTVHYDSQLKAVGATEQTVSVSNWHEVH